MQLVQQGFLAGDFEGWSGETVFEFDDGTKWQQANYSYSYYFSYRPRATVWRDGPRFLLEVQGVSAMLEVRRLG